MLFYIKNISGRQCFYNFSEGMTSLTLPNDRVVEGTLCTALSGITNFLCREEGMNVGQEAKGADWARHHSVAPPGTFPIIPHTIFSAP